MTRLTNSAFCKPGDHFVPRGTATAYRHGDIAALVCSEHRPLVETNDGLPRVMKFGNVEVEVGDLTEIK